MLMIQKNKYRTLYKSVRKILTPAQKKDYDVRIFTHLINSKIYAESELILIYVSFGSEINTLNIINHALSNNKTVAVPFCEGNEMFFYEIKSLDDLSIGKFGILTVNKGHNSTVNSFENAVCILPGLCFDLSGGRLGYGGGFYDRFLKDKHITAIALSYERCVCDCVPCEKHDIKTDYLVTENYILKTL